MDSARVVNALTIQLVKATEEAEQLRMMLAESRVEMERTKTEMREKETERRRKARKAVKRAPTR